MTRVLAEFDKFLAWWATGLAAALPQRWRQPRRELKAHLLATLDAEELRFSYQPHTASPNHPLPVVTLDDPLSIASARDWFRAHPRVHALPVILHLDPDAVLTKQLQYPASVKSHLGNVLALDIDRQTPFSGDDIYFDYSTLAQASDEKTQTIKLYVVPKSELRPVESALESLGLKLDIIDVAGHDYFATGINLLPAAEANGTERPAYRKRFALVLLWFVLLSCVPLKQLFVTQKALRLTSATEQESRAAVKTLHALRSEHEQLLHKTRFIAELSNNYVPPIIVLNEVSRLLDDGTWVRRFDLKAGTLTLNGESDKAAAIPAVLDASPFFSAPRFISPVTRNNATGKDRFQLVTDITPRGKS